MPGSVSDVDYVLYSDGGGQLRVSIAAACIVESVSAKRRRYLAAYLGAGTNNEGEIFGGLLGFSLLKARRKCQQARVNWVCDSEYALKSATQYIHGWKSKNWKTASRAPVKNIGLWKAYLHLTQGMTVTAEHVRGHSGHLENELCDELCTWVRENASRLFVSGARVVEEHVLGHKWTLIDGRGILESLRNASPENEDFEQLFKLFGAGAESSTSPGNGASNDPILKSARSILSSVQEMLALAQPPPSAERRALQARIDELLREK